MGINLISDGNDERNEEKQVSEENGDDGPQENNTENNEKPPDRRKTLPETSHDNNIDSDSNEEKENSPKKKTITKDKYAINMSDTSESEDEATVPVKKIHQYQPRNTNKLSRSPGYKKALQRNQMYQYKAKKKRISLPIDEGDTTEEEFDNLSRRSLHTNNLSAPTGSVQNSITRTTRDVEENSQGNNT